MKDLEKKISLYSASGTLSVFSESEAETERFGEALAGIFRAGDCVAMRGGMGAGKTALVRGLARGLGEAGRVTSPTYTIVNEYETAPPLFHFDLYRLGSADELYEIGLDDYLSRGGICMMEWSENVGGEVEFSHILTIAHDDKAENARMISLEALI